MDPNATLQELLASQESGDFVHVQDLCGYLIEWLEGGGFMPTLNRYDLIQLLRIVDKTAFP